MWRWIGLGLAAWLLLIPTVAAQPVAWDDLPLDGATRMAGRFFTGPGLTATGFIVVEYARTIDADAAFQPTVAILADRLDYGRRRGRPRLANDAVTLRGRDRSNLNAAYVVVRDGRFLLIGFRLTPGGDPLPSLLDVMTPLVDPGHTQPRSLVDRLPDDAAMPAGAEWAADGEVDLAAERLATPVP